MSLNVRDIHAEREFEKVEAYLRGVAAHITAEDVEVMAKARHAIALEVSGLDAEPWEGLTEGERAYERVNTVLGLWSLYKAGFVATEPSFHGMPKDAPEPGTFTCAACDDTRIHLPETSPHGSPYTACLDCITTAKTARAYIADHPEWLEDLRPYEDAIDVAPDSNARSWPRSEALTAVDTQAPPASASIAVPFGVLTVPSAEDAEASAPSSAPKNGGAP